MGEHPDELRGLLHLASASERIVDAALRLELRELRRELADFFFAVPPRVAQGSVREPTTTFAGGAGVCWPETGRGCTSANDSSSGSR